MAPMSIAGQGVWSCLQLLLLCILLTPVNGLYFFLDSHSPKCFYEELPKDTLVVGHYKAAEWNQASNVYIDSPDLKLSITVEEVFDNFHKVVNQKGSSNGKFTFTAAESGDHKICFIPSRAGHGGMLIDGHQQGTVRMMLDLAIGETSKIERTDKGKIQDIVSKVTELKARLQDIRREQVFQREREAEFRDQSEATNSRVVKWTIIQLVVLGITCAWQLTNLRAFFIKQKLT